VRFKSKLLRRERIALMIGRRFDEFFHQKLMNSIFQNFDTYATSKKSNQSAHSYIWSDYKRHTVRLDDYVLQMFYKAFSRSQVLLDISSCSYSFDKLYVCNLNHLMILFFLNLKSII
jgi:hypothetical protein